MKHAHTKAILLPVANRFLEALLARHDSFTTLVWEGRGKLGAMIGPRRILEEDQVHLPCLFSDPEQRGKHVTHAAVCGLVLERKKVPKTCRDWLDKHRVEHFVAAEQPPGGASLYVVTACERLKTVVRYGDLILAASNRPLSPSGKRGYSIVYLPAGLQDWFDSACGQWDAFSAELPELEQRRTS